MPRSPALYQRQAGRLRTSSRVEASHALRAGANGTTATRYREARSAGWWVGGARRRRRAMPLSPITPGRVAPAALAALGASSAIPIPLAQLDFAGLINVFR